MLITAEFSEKKFIDTMGAAARQNRRMSLMSLAVLIVLIIMSKQGNVLNDTLGANGKLILTLIVLFMIALFFYKWLMIRFKQNGAKESSITYDGEKIVYNCLTKRDMSVFYTSEKRIYTIKDCTKIVETAENYVFYGSFETTIVHTYGNTSSLKNKMVVIPKYFNNLEKIVYEFRNATNV